MNRLASISALSAAIGMAMAMQVPAAQAQGAMPKIVQDNMMKAQQELAEIQKRARAIVMASGKVKGVRWELDKNWLTRHGVQFSAP